MRYSDNSNYLNNNQLIPFDFSNQKDNQLQNPFMSINTSIRPPNDIFQKAPQLSFQNINLHKRLNGIDTDLISLYHHIPSHSLRLELQINKAKQDLKKIDDELKNATFLELKTEIPRLEQHKTHLEKSLVQYRNELKNSSFVNRVTEKIAGFIDKAVDKVSRVTDTVKNYFEHNKLIQIIIQSNPLLKKQNELRKLLEKHAQITNANIFISKDNSLKWEKSCALSAHQTLFGIRAEKFLKANKNEINFLGLTQKPVTQSIIMQPIRRIRSPITLKAATMGVGPLFKSNY